MGSHLLITRQSSPPSHYPQLGTGARRWQRAHRPAEQLGPVKVVDGKDRRSLVLVADEGETLRLTSRLWPPPTRGFSAVGRQACKQSRARAARSKESVVAQPSSSRHPRAFSRGMLTSTISPHCAITVATSPSESSYGSPPT
eukprot:scaffold76412_cov31-Tisochrysis_lutea.AAC.1